MNWSKSNSEGGSYQQSVEVIRSTLLQFKVVKLNELEAGFDTDSSLVASLVINLRALPQALTDDIFLKRVLPRRSSSNH